MNPFSQETVDRRVAEQRNDQFAQEDYYRQRTWLQALDDALSQVSVFKENS